MTIHPIEVESYRILRDRVALDHLPPAERAVVERVVHASADLEYAVSMVFTPGAVDAALAALTGGAPLIADVEMVRSGITGAAVECCLAEPVAQEGLTRAAAGMRLAADRHPDGAVVVVGCAPTALAEAVALVESGRFRPAVIIGLPVGFVGATEAKELARACGVPSITNIGEKGGSAVAAAAVNALIRMTRNIEGGDDLG